MTDDLGPLPACPPRDIPIRVARREISEAVLGVKNKHNLSYAELVWALTSVAAEWGAEILDCERRQAETKAK